MSANIFVRSGKLIGRENFFLPDGGDSRQEVVTAFIKQYYNDASFIPREIILPDLPEEDETAVLTTWLTEKPGTRLNLSARSAEPSVTFCSWLMKMRANFWKNACARGKSA